MFNLKYILIISLISFTLQDSHCLVTSSACYDKEPTNNAGGIANCKEAGEGVCYECVYGFALSSNQKSCISFPNCDNLAEGDKTCKECAYNFHLNSKGQCERSLCEHYDEESGICKSCYPGYYLKNKECKKINIPHCLEVDELDEKKCRDVSSVFLNLLMENASRLKLGLYDVRNMTLKENVQNAKVIIL